MALMLEITKADGSVARTPLQSQATKVAAWPGGKVRVIDTATGKSPANLTAKRVGDSLIVDNLPEGKTVEITKFYTDCSPATPCALVIDPADAAQAATITQSSPPIATLGENQALIYGSTSGSGAAAAAPAGGGLSTGAVLAGLALVGVAAAAGGGGGGGGGSTPAPDTTPPNAPVVNTVAGDSVVSAAEAAAGVAVAGTAEAGSTVTVTWGSTVKTATADGNGNWSVNFSQAELPATGPSTVSVTARDAAGNVSSATQQAVTMDTGAPDTTAPAAPVIAAVAGNDVVNNAEATAGVAVSGTAEAGSTVSVTWGSSVKTATADGSGNWSVNFAAGELPADGNTTISATATDASGNESTAGTHAVAIDTTAPGAPTANVALDGMVSGVAEAGSTVTMGEQSVTADATTGAYQFATALASGASATVIATDANGNASPGADVTAGTYEIGTAGADVIVAGTTAFVDGGAGSDVLVGGAGGSVRNYQFEYWNTPDAGPHYYNENGLLVTFSATTATGWTVGTSPSQVEVGPASLVQYTGGRAVADGEPAINVLNNARGGATDDLSGGGGRYAWDTVRNNNSGGTTLSQQVLTEAGAQYTLTMQVSNNDHNTSLEVRWGGELLGFYDSVTNSWTSGTAPSGFDSADPVATPENPALINSRETWTWTVNAAAATTALEIRAYSAAGDDGQGMMIDRVTLDAATADGGETLVGGAGTDLLFGQEGDDTLYGGALGDTAATANGVADTFVYSMRADNGDDVIKDFQVGIDRIFLVDALDTVLAGSQIPHADSNPATTDPAPGTTTANSDTNLSFADFVSPGSTSQYLTVTDEGGSVKLSFFGGSTDGVNATELGSVVLEGVAYTGQSVQDLFTSNVLVATMDGFHAGLLTAPV
ncbi:MAG: hypothetical protein KJ011_09320 [Burkholderiaceae bacterium]|nr:hypothetical protein [Burkholderiaceae bacterium]